MTDLRQAAQQALEALEELDGLDTETECVTIDVGDVITALTAALEQQQAEPPSEWPLIKNILDEYGLQAISFVAEWKAAQQQAEPVAWMDREGDLYKMPEIPNWAPPHTMLYTTPPQRKWQGLTDEDFLEVCQIAERGNYLLAFQRIQIKLKERNNG